MWKERDEKKRQDIRSDLYNVLLRSKPSLLRGTVGGAILQDDKHLEKIGTGKFQLMPSRLGPELRNLTIRHSVHMQGVKCQERGNGRPKKSGRRDLIESGVYRRKVVDPGAAGQQSKGPVVVWWRA